LPGFGRRLCGRQLSFWGGYGEMILIDIIWP
jgi:hypothetical protein